MTLLITAFAAVISTILWYIKPESNMKIGTLSLMYWGASLMWFVDAVAEYFKAGVEVFTPAASDMLNDSYLGASVVLLGLIIWLIIVLIKDPNARLKKALTNNK
ncbi:MAG: hypothetical protein HFE59_10520 [Clostridiales bacterium]|nr:hypothetical protein [Clostridiales bacterium]